MRVLIRNVALDGRPLEGDGEVFSGATVTDVVLAMKGATLFSDQRDLADYIDMVLRNAKMLSGVELTVMGDTPEEKAASFLDALPDNGRNRYPRGLVVLHLGKAVFDQCI